ncbi:MAG: tetratricopeptide repeat protein [Candidatus Aminicenantes bacterium]|nr:tetratricopeptide repeat protein [Candidatus Aminicenantes bacterium]NIM81383.1 tetratricopeptide repeat protein [Candidatus Aminicenantes bacterium]NIN20792.1 tetratricopeptide repeat protein [Candidatus Aminicenantes bacterium]NIN44569.1 tetratricopeptide repeat protein [Candidatus Aminicenantes bacterium]NIN87394.1 tetratricopeptide repeat protein [Candidatus Aminicenantes bacterium]
MKKIKLNQFKLKNKAISYAFMIILVIIVFFSLWMLIEQHKSQLKARQANYDFARGLKQKAVMHAKNNRLRLAKLFAVNSILYQVKAKKYLSMDDIKLPDEFRKQLLKYCLDKSIFNVKEVNKFVKEVEKQTSLVLDGSTPVNTKIYYSLDLDYYKNCGLYNTAVDAYQAAEYFYIMGSDYLKNRKYPKAITAYKEALKIRPRFKEALNELGWTYHFIGEKRKAKNIYKKAKAVDVAFYIQWNSNQWADVADIQKNSSDYINAAKSYNNALKINPKYYRAWNSLGEMYEPINEFDKAIKVYNKAIEVTPNLSREWKSKIAYNCGLKHIRESQYSRAIDALKESIRLYPQLDRAWLKLSDAYNKGENVKYRGEPWDLYFNNIDLKQALIFIARQVRVSFLIDPEVSGKITCELDQVKWDKALDVFLKINGCKMCKVADIIRIGKADVIEEFFQEKGKSEGKNKNIKTFTGNPLDFSFPGDDIQFVLQMIAAKAKLKIIVDPGINHSITCEFFQVPWDMAIDVMLEVHDLARFQLGNLLRIGRRDFIEAMREREQGLLSLVRSLLRLDRGQVNVADEKGKTLLSFAAQKGFSRLATFLISRGADVNAKDKWNFTPLHEAKNQETAEVLINAGANLHARSNTGLTPLRAAVYSMRLDVAKLLASKGARSNFFMDAAMGRLKQIKHVVQRNREIINTIDADGWTPLHHAASAGQFEVAAFLIEKGADLNASSNKGDTPLHIAVSRGGKKVVKLFIMNRANVNSKNKYGSTPLSIAKSNGYKKIINLLKKYGGHE